MKKKPKKIVPVIVAILIILLGGVYFETKYHVIFKKTETPISKKEDNKEEDHSDSVKNPAQEVLTEEEVKKKDALSLETESGAVLVGVIKKDSDGYYFMPEQPLNITLTYYIDRPEQFNEVIQLRMLDDSEDEWNKSIYINELVTITGEVLNPRSAGVLYLYPYDIKTGKQVSTSYAAENIEKPENTFGTMDESLLPEKMESKIVDGEYQYNFYMVSKETLYQFDNDFINFYLEFVDAFLNYETSIPCPKKSYSDYIFSILNYEFPVFYADGTYDYETVYDKDTKTLNWSYKTSSKKEHEKLIKEFETSANALLKGVKENQSESVRAQIMYHNLTPIITYDYDGLETGKSLESYYVYTKHSGVCHSFAITYSQLLTQVGIESTIATGMPISAFIGHAWTVMKIDGTYYFSDPTYEASFQNGTTYAFYGMGIKERESTDEYNVSNITIGKYQSKSMSEYGSFAKKLEIEL